LSGTQIQPATAELDRRQHFQRSGHDAEEDRAVTQVSVLLDWFEELKARVPAK